MKPYLFSYLEICLIFVQENKGMRSDEKFLMIKIGDQEYNIYIIKTYYEAPVQYEHRNGQVHQWKSSKVDKHIQLYEEYLFIYYVFN